MFKRIDARTYLAFSIPVVSIVMISVLAYQIIRVDEGSAQGVLNAVLPLFGTWVGTVLAYYFAQGNFESAASNTERLVRQLTPEDVLHATPVEYVMVKATDIYSVKNMAEKVVEVKNHLDMNSFKRLPILDSNNKFNALLEREDLTNYLSSIEAEADRNAKTIAQLLDERPDLKQTPAFVGLKATLAEARDAMARITNCKVVFVTNTGKSDEPILGMMTNTDIVQNASL